MVRAVLKNGVICPLEPLPPEWTEGWELAIQGVGSPELSPEELNKRFQELDALCKDMDLEDERRRHEAIAKMRRQAKGREEVREAEDTPEAVERWCQEWNALEPGLNSPEEIEQFQTFLADLRKKDREMARRKAGLP
jgi:hypothetical protein